MEETVFVILLLTGFCVPSASCSSIYYTFVKEEMTWHDARDYCISKHSEMVQILGKENATTMMNTPTGGHTDKAWIGLYENILKWTWVDGQIATYSNWSAGQPDNLNAKEFCVSMNDGFWKDNNCSEKKPSVCVSDGGGKGLNYFLSEKEITWTDAEIHCEDKNSTLATIPDKKTNDKIQELLSRVPEAWIGLNRPNIWMWSDTGKIYRFINWQKGQPDNLKGQETCATVVVKDGTWTDENCKATYPFFCYGIPKSRETRVRMKIQSSANMEDPARSADLQLQLREAFAKQGVTDFKLTWKKLPVKQPQENSDDACRPCESNS